MLNLIFISIKNNKNDKKLHNFSLIFCDENSNDDIF